MYLYKPLLSIQCSRDKPYQKQEIVKNWGRGSDKNGILGEISDIFERDNSFSMPKSSYIFLNGNKNYIIVHRANAIFKDKK